MPPRPDGAPRSGGRRVRGERRRAILEAARRVVERDGVAGVSHRSVAREAGVPPTSATCYYATPDDLLIATLTRSADRMASSFRNTDPAPAALDGLLLQGLIAEIPPMADDLEPVVSFLMPGG